MNMLEEGKVSDYIRQSYIADVTQIVPFDEQEKEDKAYVIDWLASKVYPIVKTSNRRFLEPINLPFQNIFPMAFRN